jgi:hypothetical protein
MLVFVGDMGEEKAIFDADGNVLSPGAVVAKRIDPTRHCKGNLWVWTGLNGTEILTFSLSSGAFTSSISPGNISGFGGRGV